MEDKEFYKFRASSETDRAFDFNEADWADLNQRLDEADTQKKQPIAAWWWWAAAAMFIPLVFSNIYWYNNWQKSQTNYELLAQQIQPQPTTDTIIQTKYVYLKDTVETTKIVYQDRYRWIPAKNTLFPQEDRWVATHPSSHLFQTYKPLLEPSLAQSLANKKWIETNFLYPQERLLSKPVRVEISSSDIASKQTETTDLSKSSITSLNYLPILDYPVLSRPTQSKEIWANNWDIKDEKKQRRKMWSRLKKTFQPNGFAVGVSMAGLLPIAEDLEVELGQSFDINAALILGGGVRLFGEFNTATLRYTSSNMNPTIGIPLVAAPGDDYVFQDAQVVREFYNYTIGLKKFWNKNRKWQPFVSVGYGATQLKPYEVIYDFHNQVSPDVDIKLEKEIPQDITQYHVLHGGLGITYSWKDNWRLGLSSFYRTQVNQRDLSIPDYLSIKAALSYQF